jgi:hypothetical protein
MLGYASRRPTDPEQKKVTTKVVNPKVKATGHGLESMENLGTLQSPRARCRVGLFIVGD